MDGDTHNFLKKRPNTQFKRKGGKRKGKRQNHSPKYFSENSSTDDTLYRILCPSRKIGSVIGKGGGRIRALREETKANISVADSLPGSDERVITIYSSPTKNPMNVGTNEVKSLEPHCAAQDALLKVHDRVIEEDLFGGMTFDDENANNMVTTRLLVSNNTVGCVLGKGGDVIQKLRSETGANIRVFSADHLPTCAMDTDELVQISGKPDIVKNALYVVSTLLHQNPRKDKPSSDIPYGRQILHSRRPPMEDMLPYRNPMWFHRNSFPHLMQPMPHEFRSGGFDEDVSGEFYMKIVCSSERIGGVIGKGGVIVKRLQQDTGTSIHVAEASVESGERVIRVSSHEALWNPRSQTIDAILFLQNKTSESSEPGIITTRLLVPSSKVGCILGQRGQVINDMRWRTQADIKVYSKDEKPKYASEDEELVEVSGNAGVSRDALAEIASRLRTRILRDAYPGDLPVSDRSMHGYGPPPGGIHGGSINSGALGHGSSGGYEHLKKDGRHEYEQKFPHEYEQMSHQHEYERQSHPAPPTAPGYSDFNRSMLANTPNNLGGSVTESGGTIFPNFGEIDGASVKWHENPQQQQQQQQQFGVLQNQNQNQNGISQPYLNTNVVAYSSVNHAGYSSTRTNSEGTYGAYPGAYPQNYNYSHHAPYQ